jgi:transposase
MSKHLRIETPEPGRRRRYTAEQKRALLDDAVRPGGSISTTARRYGVAPSLLFQWKRTMSEEGQKGLESSERLVPVSEVKRLQERVRELERALGRKTMENEILTEAVRLTQQKKTASRANSSGKGGGR